eukprot:3176320-Pyramimonas_sp.AAC.1
MSATDARTLSRNVHAPSRARTLNRETILFLATQAPRAPSAISRVLERGHSRGSNSTVRIAQNWNRRAGATEADRRCLRGSPEAEWEGVHVNYRERECCGNMAPCPICREDFRDEDQARDPTARPIILNDRWRQPKSLSETSWSIRDYQRVYQRPPGL